MKRHLPNLLTLLNLSSGVMAIIMASDGLLYQAAVFIAVGAIFDLFDGMVARALGVSSPIGVQLDSLADMVSFGVAPALIARELLLKAAFIEQGEIEMTGILQVLPFVPFLLIACAALRLAKFNVDEEQKVDFRGLPTPAVGLFWLSIPLAMRGSHDTHLHIFENPYVLAAACVVLALLMVSNVRLLSMKFDAVDKARSRWQLFFVILSGGLFLWLRFAALPIIILLYLLLSLIRNTTLKNEIQS